MMGHRQELKGGMEFDGLTEWADVIRFRPGQRKYIKRKHNKRGRREARHELLRLVDQYSS